MTSKMFKFITHTVNPIGGGYAEIVYPDTLKVAEIKACPYDCSYCWAKALINKHQFKKYQGEYRVIDKELKEYPDGSIVFVQDMTDIGDPIIPREIIEKILEWIKAQPRVTFLLLTKNPDFYHRYKKALPTNIWAGATIETNRPISRAISKAPSTSGRFVYLNALRRDRPEIPRFICVEPVMDFDLASFGSQIIEVRPTKVAIGYDNYDNNLPEPSLQKVEKLIMLLYIQGIDVETKTLRKPKPRKTQLP